MEEGLMFNRDYITPKQRLTQLQRPKNQQQDFLLTRLVYGETKSITLHLNQKVLFMIFVLLDC